MKTQEIMQMAEGSLLHTYNRYPIVLDHGEGVYLYDTDGKKYLDFAAGIAVFGLGYGNEGFNQAVKDQIDKLVHTSNLFYNEPAAKAAAKLTALTGMDRVFFTNSGTEAIEGAIKLARKYAYNKDKKTDHEIIAMKHSFHGRSMGALSVTGNEKYQEPFKPLIGGVQFAEFNNLESVKALVNDRTCAIILEPLQGEGGIYPATEAFIQGVRQICDENDILMICDEIQCGMGRTGSMYCYQQYGIRPDVVTTAKALGNGFPVGAFLCRESCAALVPGDHGSTYGGNPLVCAAANAVLDQFEALNLTDHVKEVGAYLYEKLEELTKEKKTITAHRGMGLMQGLEFSVPLAGIITKAQELGLIIISASGNVIRFVPPLVIEKEHVDEMIAILTQCIE
ncbi:MAG: aspartate aminotransferase family protein [Lachnospiraceae bacterium]|nr:aspartate aminotransferase family protein [Lachnospiraceae bacterium]